MTKTVCAGTPAFFMLFHSLIFFFARITHHSIDPVHIRKQSWFPFVLVEPTEMLCKVRVCGSVLCSPCLCILAPNSYFIGFPGAVISYCLNEYSMSVACEGMRKRHYSNPAWLSCADHIFMVSQGEEGYEIIPCVSGFGSLLPSSPSFSLCLHQ